MKKAYALIFLFSSLLGNHLFAQLYGNEWIKPSQSYYKLKIVQEGIYRVDSAYLRSNGVPSTWLADQAKLQLFHNGVEQYIYVNDADHNNVLNAGDFIEFYATKNDGSF